MMATCASCPHFDRQSSLCRCEPPRDSWPRVHETDWCGRHPDRMLALATAMRQAAAAQQREVPNLVIPRKQ